MVPGKCKIFAGWLPAYRQTVADRTGRWTDGRRLAGTIVGVETSYGGEERPHGTPDFGELVDAHYASLYRFALSLTRTESDACDLVQETFHIWGAKGHQLREASKAKTWLFTTLHRLYLDAQRRAARFPHLELEEAGSELLAVDTGLVNRLDAAGLAELLGRIHPEYQAAVALFYLEDYSYNEIAEVLGIPLGTVKSRIARGLAQLKRVLIKDLGEDIAALEEPQ